MPGLEELGLFQNLTGQQGESPLGTLTALKALRATQMPGMTAPQSSVNQGSPFKTTQVDMPDFSGGNVDAAMEQGAKRAEREATSKTGGSDGLKFNPMLVDLAREMAPTDEDRNSALTKGGIGMALAGGQTGNFLTALAAGLGQGTDHFDKLRAMRAERALKEGELNSNIEYKQGMLGNAQQQTDIQSRTADTDADYKGRMAGYYENQNQLIPSQIDENRAKAESSRAGAAKDLAIRDSYLGGGDGIPADIRKEANKARTAALQKAGSFENPEAQAAFGQQVFLTTAESMLRGRGQDTTQMSVFSPLFNAAKPPPAPGGEKKPATTPWVGGTYGWTPPKDGPTPLAGNADIFQALGAEKTFLAKHGFLDPGSKYNEGINELRFLYNDVQQADKVGGHQLKAVMDNIGGMIPKQGELLDTSKFSYDKIKSLYRDLLDKQQQAQNIVDNPMANKASQREAAQSLPILNRALGRISGDKDFSAWERPTDGKTGPPADAVKALREGHGSPEQFDEIFGAGAAKKALGK